MTIADSQFTCKWRARITPIGESAVNFDSGGGILSNIGIKLTSEGMAEFAFSLLNDNGAYSNAYNIGDQVEIYLDASTGTLGATKRILGFIKKVGYRVDSNDNKILTIIGMDYLSKFKRIIVREMYRGIPGNTRTYEDIITNGTDGLLALYDPTVTSSGVQATGKSLTVNEVLDFRYVTLYDCFERIRDLVGDWIYYISPAKVFCFQPRGYVDNGKVFSTTTEEIEDCEVVYDDDMMGNQVFLFGGKDFTALSKSGWSATKHASLGGTVANAYNSDVTTGWEGGISQATGHWFQLDLGSIQNFGRIYVDNSYFATKYPRNYRIEASKDGTYYETLIEVTGNEQRDIICTLDKQDQFRYIKFVITANDTANWSIGEIFIYSYLDMLSKMMDNLSYSEFGQYDKKITDNNIDIKSQMKARIKKELNLYSQPNISLSIDLRYFYDCSPNEIISLTIPGTPLSSTKLKVKSVSFSENLYGTFKERIEMIS